MPITPYLKTADGRLTPLRRIPCDNEGADLQDLLVKNPDLLPGEQINPEAPRKWLVIAREAEITDGGSGAPRWSLDLLLADQDAVPTLVEVKRFHNTQARREVVGQLIEYAANGPYYWTSEQLREWTGEHAASQGSSLEKEIAQLQPAESQAVDEYFESLKKNLEKGRLRIIFFLEEAPSELKSIVDFLNKQMERTEVLLVEAGHYRMGDDVIVIPQLFGYSEDAHQAKRGEVGVPKKKKEWDWPSFREDAKRRGVSTEVIEEIAELRLMCEQSPKCEVSWGHGEKFGTLSLSIPEISKSPIYWWFSDGTLVLYLAELVGSEKAEATREYLIDQAQQYGSLEGKTRKYPNLPPDSWIGWGKTVFQEIMERFGGG